MFLKIADWLVFGLLGMDPQSKGGAVLHFFIYDTLKIFFLLFVLIAVIGFLRTFLPDSRIRQWMGQRGLAANFYAAIFGAITPFCSCSSIPIFFGFLKAGIPLGVSFSFLITSPLINEYLVVLMLGFFGWKIAAVYVIGGIALGVASGAVIEKMNLTGQLVEDFAAPSPQGGEVGSIRGFGNRAKFGLSEACAVIEKIWIWVLVGVGIGAFIHNYVPEETIHGMISKTGPFSVPIAVILGVPLYGSCAAIVPVALVLFQKGIPLGTSLAFMMAIAALSLPEAVMLRRAMRLKLILIFFGVTASAIILIGYLFNFLQKALI
ncbi:MAG: permease [Candidatus Omnitrophota bacterium]|nr:permease [Candidatus Omnitrophota bacterium]MDZ4241577.1 permease [Candidatus Omnitrophota bacterium]